MNTNKLHTKAMDLTSSNKKPSCRSSVRECRPYRLRPKPSVRLPITERKRFLRGGTVPCTLY